MKTSAVATLLLAPIGSLALSGNGKSTRYWDCCKPSCGWPGKATLSQGPVRTCDKNGNTIFDANTKSGCDNGSAYTCVDTSPWAVNDLVSYGFAATALSGSTESGWCCACYKLTFTSGRNKGKIMVVQSVNTGGDLGENHFDLQIPGGGLGLFDGCTSQFGQSLPGARYGGVSSRDQCDLMPAALRAGCQWRFDWFKNADNPDHTFEQVQCPAEIVAKSSCLRPDDSSFPKFVMPSDVSWSPPTSNEVVGAWQQCDSVTWEVQKKCVDGYTCKRVDDYYWQCQVGSPDVPNPGNDDDDDDTDDDDDDTCENETTTSTTSTRVQTSTSTSRPPATTTTPGGGNNTGAERWGQCGGIGWTGPTTCKSPYTCTKVNDWYFQCL